MPAIFGQPMASPALDPLLERARTFADLCIARAARQLTNGAATRLDPRSIEGCIAAFVGAQLRPAPGVVASSGLRGAARTLKKRAADSAQALSARPAAWGALSRVDLTAAPSLAQQTRGKVFDDLITKDSPAIRDALIPGLAAQLSGQPPMSRADFVQAMVRRLQPGHAALLKPAAPVPTPPSHTHLRLQLVKLRCDAPVGFEITDFGKDRINIGGKGFDSAGGNYLIAESFVGEFANAGADFSFPGGGRDFASYDLSRAGPWPRLFYASIAIAEKDADGGFIEFLVKLWDAIDEAVVAALTAAVLSALAAAGFAMTTGAAAGTVAPGVGTLVGAIVGALAGFVIGWVLSTLSDDIFAPVEVAPLYLESAAASFGPGGAAVSDAQTVQFVRDSAQYTLTYRWRLV